MTRTDKALSGRTLDSITVDAVRAGDVTPDDVRIHPDTLHHQADVAAAAKNPQLADALRCAAEITQLPDDEVMSVYEALRPGRSTAAQLEQLASSLQSRGLTRIAALAREASAAYARRSILP